MVKRSNYSAKTLRFTVVNHSKFLAGVGLEGGGIWLGAGGEGRRYRGEG